MLQDIFKSVTFLKENQERESLIIRAAILCASSAKWILTLSAIWRRSLFGWAISRSLSYIKIKYRRTITKIARSITSSSLSTPWPSPPSPSSLWSSSTSSSRQVTRFILSRPPSSTPLELLSFFFSLITTFCIFLLIGRMTNLITSEQCLITNSGGDCLVFAQQLSILTYIA